MKYIIMSCSYAGISIYYFIDPPLIEDLYHYKLALILPEPRGDLMYIKQSRNDTSI